MNWTIGNPAYLLLLLALPFLAWLLLSFIRWRRRSRERFADTRFRKEIFSADSAFMRWFPWLYLPAFAFLVLAMADLLAGSEELKVERKLGNVVFMMDLSNSMNAEDVAPDRLTKEKQLIIGTLQRMQDQKVGVIIFAGDAYSVMPLTTDYAAIENYIASVETGTISHQGTDFLRAMQEAAILLRNVPRGSGEAVLISDGEDNEDNVDAAVSLAKQQNIRVTTVGIGTAEGGPIPEYLYGQLMGYMTDNAGQTVISRLDTQALVRISNSTGGVHIDGNNETADAAIIDAIGRNRTGVSTTTHSQSAKHYFQYFLAVSLFLLFIIYLTNPRRDLNI